jgi:hypothetical protein
MQNKILIVDNDIKTSLKYKKWLEVGKTIKKGLCFWSMILFVD